MRELISARNGKLNVVHCSRVFMEFIKVHVFEGAVDRVPIRICIRGPKVLYMKELQTIKFILQTFNFGSEFPQRGLFSKKCIISVKLFNFGSYSNIDG